MKRLRRLIAVAAVASFAVLGLGVGVAHANHCAFVNCHGTTSNDYYYAQTGPDGLIHCAEGDGYGYTWANGSPYLAVAFSYSRTKQGYQCFSDEYVPGSYIQAAVQLFSNGVLCAASPWRDGNFYFGGAANRTNAVAVLGGVTAGFFGNPSPPVVVPVDLRQTPCTFPGNLTAVALHHVAVNFGWRDGAEYTAPPMAGG